MNRTALLVDGAFRLARYREARGERDANDARAPGVRQSQVDMKLGIDIAALTFRKLANPIIRVADDADFIPAAKLPRYEGIDCIRDPMWQGIAPEPHEHIDGLQSMFPRPF